MIIRLLVTAMLAASTVPQARYDAVVGGLDVWSFTTAEATVYRATNELPVYDFPDGSVVAVLPRLDFMGSPSVVVATDRRGDWTRVLTPSRQKLPSGAGSAAAQTSGWVLSAQLTEGVPLDRSIVVSVADQTLAIVSHGEVEKTFRVGVGTPGTPTPTGVTGYLEERYLDPAQGEDHYRVQLTSLHSTAADEPFGGNDGGLIGLHFDASSHGAVSHGCLWLTASAIAAVDRLPLGTLVTILP